MSFKCVLFPRACVELRVPEKPRKTKTFFVNGKNREKVIFKILS